MIPKELPLKEVCVSAFAVLYWGGVLINAARIKKHIKKSPNMRPKGTKERLLWLGWFLVISGWFAQPLIAYKNQANPIFTYFTAFQNNMIGLYLGLALAIAGYLGTLWCYQAMGDSWRIGVDKNEQLRLITHGPYKHLRHPIYSYQIVILIGMFLLLPTPFSLLLLLIHYLCARTKALDEENYLLQAENSSYQTYFSHTGRFFPTFKKTLD